MEKFVENFAAQFEETDISEFKEETNFRDLEEWSSISALSVLAMVEEEYGIQVNGEEMRSSNTIGDLYKIVKSKL